MSDYETDFLVWSEHQADLLRRMAGGERVNDQVDWNNVAEEIESLGTSDRRELASRVRTILRHLIRLQISTASEPRPSWRNTIVEQRAGLRRLLNDSPSLIARVAPAIAEELATARVLALGDLTEYGETPRKDPAGLGFTDDQVRGPWLPESDC